MTAIHQEARAGDHQEAEEGRRERKKHATRRALQDAALALAAARGPDHVTVEAISEAADVSPRTFFNYFSCKEEALVGEPPALGQRLRAVLETAPPGTPIASAVRTVVRQVAAESAERKDELLTRKRIVAECPALLPRHHAAFSARERELTAAIASHLGTDPETDIYPALLAAVSATALRVAFQRWDGQAGHRLEGLVDQAFDILERGI
ncbi:MAG: TetR family transcriptional regulator [Acidimicrobiales bacterium]